MLFAGLSQVGLCMYRSDGLIHIRSLLIHCVAAFLVHHVAASYGLKDPSSPEGAPLGESPRFAVNI